METRTVQSGRVGGSVRAPASKSALQRTIACATLAKGTSRIRGVPLCADALAALGIARDLEAKVREFKGGVEIEGSPLFCEDGVARAENAESPAGGRARLILSCGESGLCMRMFSPIAALLARPVVLAGSGSLARRPMHMVESALTSLGVSCTSEKGFQPLRIQGPLRSQRAYIDAEGSSQLITGLLIAMPLLKGNTELRIENLVSSGYLDLTIDVAAHFGVRIQKLGDGDIFAFEGGQSYRASSIDVEGDWSGAAFLAVAAAIAGTQEGLSIEGLANRTSQPDKAIVDVLLSAGATVRQVDDAFIVFPGELKPFSFDATDCPDIFPPLAALAGAIAGVSTIKGVYRLASKESNRATALQSMLANLSVRTELDGDTMAIHGGQLRSGRVASCGDHRIAMAAAVAALAVEGDVHIEGAECVSKSWPGFFEILDSIRAR